ncbi:MAG: hypothetical protein RL885_20950 [Planctomycetota bacterium]
MTPFPIINLETNENAWRAKVQIPEDTSYVDGHFPGEAILPGVAEIGLVLQVLERGGVVANLTGIKGFRFRNPVKPGDTLEVVLKAPGPNDSSATFDLRRGTERIANGTLLLASDEGTA